MAVGQVWNIPARVADFTGRAVLLDELDTTLVTGGRVVVQALTGTGGVGKTSTAIEYAHRHRDRFDIAWWIRAEDPELVPDRLAALAQALNLGDPIDPIPEVLARLRARLHRLDRWLIVFDNAEDPRALAPLIPGGRAGCSSPPATSTGAAPRHPSGSARSPVAPLGTTSLA